MSSRNDERDQITEVRLRSHLPRAGESLAQLVSRTGEIWKVKQAAVANGLAVDATLEVDFAVKVPIRQRYRSVVTAC